METKYQQENPNNCRVKIDFEAKGDLPPVHFEYVGKDSPFKIAYKCFFNLGVRYYGLSLLFSVGIFIGGLIYQNLKATLVSLGIIVGLYAFIWVFPLIFAIIFVKNKKLYKLLPYIWVIGKKKYYANFKSEDVIDNKIEIPLYCNQFLGYILEGDFLDKIKSIEVIEHPFNLKVRKEKGKYELKPNEYLWKATFYFTEQPKGGELKTSFI